MIILKNIIKLKDNYKKSELITPPDTSSRDLSLINKQNTARL